jgi:hypothetical protein
MLDMRMILKRDGEMRRDDDDVKALQQQGKKRERGQNREKTIHQAGPAWVSPTISVR